MSETENEMLWATLESVRLSLECALDAPSLRETQALVDEALEIILEAQGERSHRLWT